MGSSEDDQNDESIPFNMYKTACLIALQSFMYGYCFSALNGCIVTGDDNSGSDCYNGTDSSCPKGTIYNQINLSDGNFFEQIAFFQRLKSIFCF
jgi:hypothetical protein